jgi:SAM-dependent methyltransferase
MQDGFPNDIRILDVGAGSGGYSDLLRPYFPKIDGLEIFQPYVDKFSLFNKYVNLYLGNILQFDFKDYDYIIMGDILEHLSVDEAKSVINKVQINKQCLMVAVPYLYEQGAEFDNVYETHKQPDLTHSLFLERYPMMERLFGNHEYGYYINY